MAEFKVVNEYGVEFDSSVALELMDDDIREELLYKLSPCNMQDLFNAYCKAHEEKFGEQWELAKANPVY